VSWLLPWVGVSTDLNGCVRLLVARRLWVQKTEVTKNLRANFWSSLLFLLSYTVSATFCRCYNNIIIILRWSRIEYADFWSKETKSTRGKLSAVRPTWSFSRKARVTTETTAGISSQDTVLLPTGSGKPNWYHLRFYQSHRTVFKSCLLLWDWHIRGKSAFVVPVLLFMSHRMNKVID